MAHPYHHQLSCARRFGGKPEDYAITAWFDETKAVWPDMRHRALRHHAEGIFLFERIFGSTITNSAGKIVPVRYIGEQHVREDLGYIPAASDWLRAIKPEAWMFQQGSKQRYDTDGNLL